MAVDRTSIRREVEMFAAMLVEEVSQIGLRADGSMNAADMLDAIEDAAARYSRDGVVRDSTLTRIRTKKPYGQ